MIDLTKCHTTITKYFITDKPSKILSYNPKRFAAYITIDNDGSDSVFIATTPSDLDKAAGPYIPYGAYYIIGPYEWFAKDTNIGGDTKIDVLEYIQD